jgi:hypothetical protein
MAGKATIRSIILLEWCSKTQLLKLAKGNSISNREDEDEDEEGI